MKKILSLSLVIIMMLLCGCSNKNMVTVNVEIDVSDILANYDMLDESLQDEKYVPLNGKILETTAFSVEEGSSAIEVLKTVSKEKNIQIDVSEGYAKGINYIYEKSCGSMSGWVYEINGNWAMEEYTVSEGDAITWKYICDFNNF